MLAHSIHSSANRQRPRRSSALPLLLRLCLGLAVVAAVGTASANAQQPAEPLSNPLPRPTSVILPAANRAPDANDQMEMQQKGLKRASFEAANAERKRQLDSDSALLLKLASELKAEIDKTPQDTLSLSVVRKAEEIERLAHNVQVKMKLTVGAD
jgi:hypothetical protein